MSLGHWELVVQLALHSGGEVGGVVGGVVGVGVGDAVGVGVGDAVGHAQLDSLVQAAFLHTFAPPVPSGAQT